jgi:hypothetical protein
MFNQLSRSSREKKKRPTFHLTDIDTIDRSGTSMLTNSKDLNPLSQKRGRKRDLPST